MARSHCPNCGVTVDVVEIEGEGAVPLDIFDDRAYHGEARYVIVKWNPLRGVRSHNGRGMPDHRANCPHASVPAR